MPAAIAAMQREANGARCALLHRHRLDLVVTDITVGYAAQVSVWQRQQNVDDAAAAAATGDLAAIAFNIGKINDIIVTPSPVRSCRHPGFAYS